MWPFKTKQTPIPVEVLADAMDELGLVRLNDLGGAIEQAFKKHLDPSSLGDFSDEQGGHFNTEFSLVASSGRMKGVYRREPWVYTTASLIARTLATVPYDVINKATGEVDKQHPMNDVLAAGNELQDNMSMDWAGNLDLVLAGNTFFVQDKNKILHVPVEFVEIRPAENPSTAKHPIDGINIQRTISPHGAQSDTAFIPWENVIHFKLPNPFNPFVGMSMISAASRPILLDRHKNEFEMAFYLRGATNSGVIETTEDITKQRMERLMRTFEGAFTGRRNWFRQLFLPKGAKWVNSGLTMTEMQHLEGLRENRLTLLAVIGVPPSKVGIVQDVNRATSEVQEKTFWENTIIPLAKMKAAGWNNSHLVKEVYKGEVEVKPNFDGIEAVEGGIITRGEQAKAVDNIATINEQRAIAGLPPLKKTDPRGNLFLVELTSQSLNPFGAATPTARPEDMGPDDGITGDLHAVDIGEGDGENPHTHTAEVDDLGNGKTTGTTGEGTDHEHEIVAGEVEPGGVDGHAHPSVDISAELEEEKAFQRVKQIAIGVQESIETGQGRKFLKAYNRNLAVKFEQARKGLRTGVTDIRSWLAQGTQLRMEQYQGDGEKVLQETLGRGFTFGQSQTRSFRSAVSRKLYNFTPIDEMAIDIIKERTEDEQRRVLEQRNIENFLGFDSTSTEQIVALVEQGLADGRTTEEIAKTVEQDHGETYSDQSFTIARTETLFSVSQGLAWQHDTLGEVFTEVHKQWFHVGDVGSNPDARRSHATFEKAGVKGVVPSEFEWIDEDGSHLRYPRDPQASASSTINCRCGMVSVIPKTAQSNAEQIINRG